MPDEKDADSSPADETSEEESKGTQPDDEETVDTNVPWNKDPRFKDFIGKRKTLKQYEAIGAPSEIVAYVQHLEARIAQLDSVRDDNEPKSDEQKEDEQRLKTARKKLREIEPAIEEIDSVKASQEAYYNSLQVRAVDETGKLMESAGLDVTPQSLKAMANVLAGIIEGDEVALAEYNGNPREAVRMAFKQLAKIGKSAGTDRASQAAIQTEKEKQSRLPKPQTGTGALGSKKAEGPIKGMKDAYERSKAYLKGEA